VTFEDFEMDAEAMHSAESGDIHVAARLNLLNKDTGESRMIRPVYIILADRTQHYQSGTFDDWDVTVSFTGMNVDSGSIRLVFEGEGLENIQPDWILVQAYEKPFINLLWVGSIILLFGFGIAFYRRLGDSSTNTRAV